MAQLYLIPPTYYTPWTVAVREVSRGSTDPYAMHDFLYF